MKELKWLRVKFVLSNMVMVTLVIGLAFLAVGYFTKTRMEQDNEQFLWKAAAAETMPEFWEAGTVRAPYFILITDGNDEIIGVEGQYGPEPEDEDLKRLAAQSLSAAEDGGLLEMYQLRYLRRPFESGYVEAHQADDR